MLIEQVSELGIWSWEIGIITL